MINRDSAFIIGGYVAGCIAQADVVPDAGESIIANAFLLQPGGKGFNLLTGLHRLGAAVDGILPVGSDLWGRMSSALLEELGLPASWLLRVPGPSGGAVGLVDGKGENRIAVAPGANALLVPEHLDQFRPALEIAAIVAGQFEVPDQALLHAFTIAKNATARTFLNPSPYRAIPEAMLSMTDIIVVNRTEAAALARQLDVSREGQSRADELRALASGLHRRGIDLVIVTLGSEGAAAFRASGPEHHQAAFPVEVRDTTGAGDAFNAGLIAALLEHAPLPAALRDAAASGAIVASAPGVLDNLPDRRALASFQL